MSSQEIEIHFAEMKQLAEKLEQTAEDIRLLTGENRKEVISRIKNAWLGETADAFVNKEMLLNARMTETAGKLQQLAEEIFEKARQLYEAEMWNYMVASTRSYC